MDAAVVAAMAKWPNVPAVFGWLALTARAEWRIKGERIAHAGLTDFFGRNYDRDAAGRYFVQNGPQRIFAELQAAPYAARREAHGWRRMPDGRGGPASRAWLTVEGELLLELDGAPALLDDRDWPDLTGALVDAAGRPLDQVGWDALWADAGAWLQLPEGRLALERSTLAEVLAGFGVQNRPAAD